METRQPSSEHARCPWHAWLPLLALALAGCVGPPPYECVTEVGVVRAGSLDEARAVGALLEDFHPRIRRLLPGTRNVSVEVWVQEEPRALWIFGPGEGISSFGIPSKNRIHLRADPDVRDSDLAHELVHLLLGDSWESIPPALEEGLCDHVSILLVPESSQGLRAQRLLLALALTGESTWEFRLHRGGVRGMTSVTVTLSDPDIPSELQRAFKDRGWSLLNFLDPDVARYGIGYLAVSRLVAEHGYAGLHALCARARAIPDAEARARLFADVSGLDESPATWREAFRAEFTEQDLRWYAEHHADALAVSVTSLCRPFFDDLDAVAFLDEARPELGIEGQPWFVPLYEIGAFRARLQELWPRSASVSAVGSEDHETRRS